MVTMSVQCAITKQNVAKVLPRVSNRIGIFAGSFDPIHEGHIETSLSCVRELGLEQLFFMVEQNPWGDKSPVGISYRRKMVDIAISNFPQLGQLELDDHRFSIDKTLIKLENKFPSMELYFIFGADVFLKMNIKSWPKLDKLLKHYIVVIERNELTEWHITEHAITLGIVTAILPSQHLHHSSTDVRMQPRNSILWVPKKIADYIELNNLYEFSDSDSM